MVEFKIFYLLKMWTICLHCHCATLCALLALCLCLNGFGDWEWSFISGIFRSFLCVSSISPWSGEIILKWILLSNLSSLSECPILCSRLFCYIFIFMLHIHGIWLIFILCIPTFSWYVPYTCLWSWSTPLPSYFSRYWLLVRTIRKFISQPCCAIFASLWYLHASYCTDPGIGLSIFTWLISRFHMLRYLLYLLLLSYDLV